MERQPENAAAAGVPESRDPASVIRDFHAHLYFDPDEAGAARVFAQAAARRFGLPMGHVHSRPVGPHPRGSCQLTVPRECFGDVIQWLALNRGKFTVFVHPSTGDDLADHLFHAMWLGPSEALVPPPGFAGKIHLSNR